MALDHEGNVWYAAFWGTLVGRLDPRTGIVTEYPFPGKLTTNPTAVYAGSGPWDLTFDPRGKLYVGEFFDSTVNILTLEEGKNCTELDENGKNPCVRELVLPVDRAAVTLPAITYDSTTTRLWFTHGQKDGRPATIGFYNGQRITYLEDLSSVIPHDENGHFSDIKVDSSGRIWVLEFERKRVMRLTPKPGLPCAL